MGLTTEEARVLGYKNTFVEIGQGLHHLNSFPADAQEIDLYHNELRSLPPLPSNTTSLSCSRNPLRELPALPPTLQSLHCEDTELKGLPSLPAGLVTLVCGNEGFRELPALPDSLDTLHVVHIEAQALPPLPPQLLALYFGGNICNPPRLPRSLHIFECSFSHIRSLPALPPSIHVFVCSDTLVTYTPIMPFAVIQGGPQKEFSCTYCQPLGLKNPRLECRCCILDGAQALGSALFLRWSEDAAGALAAPRDTELF